MTVHLVLGGARSGKSSYSESLVNASDKSASKHYVATAIAFDQEMTDRIAHHKRSRGDEWQEHECPRQLANQLEQFSANDVVLVDCLTLWLNNVIYNDGDTLSEPLIQAEVASLVESLKSSAADIVLVSNEVGMGVVPMGEVSRLFVDNAGWMNQAIAKVAERVTLVAAGLPLVLKDIAVEETERG